MHNRNFSEKIFPLTKSSASEVHFLDRSPGVNITNWLREIISVLLTVDIPSVNYRIDCVTNYVINADVHVSTTAKLFWYSDRHVTLSTYTDKYCEWKFLKYLNFFDHFTLIVRQMDFTFLVKISRVSVIIELLCASSVTAKLFKMRLDKDISCSFDTLSQ